MLRVRLGIAMICIPLVFLLFSAYPMITFHQERDPMGPGEHQVRPVEVFEPVVREAGYARAAMALMSVCALFFMYRRRERAGWLIPAILLVAYFLPVFVVPLLIPFRGWEVLCEGVIAPLAEGVLLNFLFAGLVFLGLALCFPELFKRIEK